MSGNANSGFASMDAARQRLLASLGGKTAHAKGRAHQWTTEKARLAGIKGGRASALARQKRKEAAAAASSL